MGFRFRASFALIAGLSALLLLALLAACSANPTKPTPTTVAMATVPTPTQAPTPTAAPTAVPTPVVYTVGNTGGDGVALRKTAGTTERLKAWPDDTKMTVVGADVEAAGEKWSNVRDPDGTVGWIAKKYLVAAVATAPTAATATKKPTPTYSSGGLGLSRTDWENEHGREILGPNIYENNKYFVMWDDPENAHHIERTYGDSYPVSLVAARAESKLLIPADSIFVRTYAWRDNRPVDVYRSTSLIPRISPMWWIGSEAGTFIVLYRFTNYPFRGDGRDRVTSLVIATGNNP